MSTKPNVPQGMPETFTVDDLLANGFTEAELTSLSQNSENNPALFAEAEKSDAAPQENAAVIAPPVQVGDAPPAPAAPQAAPMINAAALQAMLVIPQPEAAPADISAAEAVIAGSDAALNALQDKYDAGDLSREEMIAEQKKLINAEASARAKIESVTTTTQSGMQRVIETWNAAQQAYHAANGTAGLEGDEHYEAWDRHLRAVTADATLRQALTAEQLLQLAHKRYADEYQAVKGKPLPFTPPAPTVAKLAPRADARPEAMQSLAAVNGDLSNAIADSEIAAFDRTAQYDPMQAEAFLAKMSPAAEAAFLKALSGA